MRNNNEGDTARNFIGFLHDLSHELGYAPTFSWSTLTQPLVCTSMNSGTSHKSMEQQVRSGAADMPRGDICEDKTPNSVHYAIETPTFTEWDHPHSKPADHGQADLAPQAPGQQAPDQDLEEYVNDLVPALLMVNRSTHNMDMAHRQEAFKVTADAALARRATGMAWSDALSKRMSNYCNKIYSLAHDQNSIVNFNDLADMAMEEPDYMTAMECASSSCIKTPVSSEGTSSCEFSDHNFGAFHHGSTGSLASSDQSSMVDSTSELMHDDMDAINYVQSGEPCPLTEIACSSDAVQRNNVTSSGEQLLSMSNIYGDSNLKSAAASDQIYKEINARLMMIRSCCKGWEEDAERRIGSSGAAMESLDCLQQVGGSATREKHVIEEAANVKAGGDQAPSTELAQHGEVAPEAKADDIRKSDVLYADHVNYGNMHGVDRISYAISDPWHVAYGFSYAVSHAAYGFPCASCDHGEREYFLKHRDVVGVSPPRGYTHLMQHGHDHFHGVSHVNEAHHDVASAHADVAHWGQLHDDVMRHAHLPCTDVAHSASVLYDVARGDDDVACNAEKIQQHDMASEGAEVAGGKIDMMLGKQRQHEMGFCNADADQQERGSVAIDEAAGREVMRSAPSDGVGDEVEVHAGDVDVEVEGGEEWNGSRTASWGSHGGNNKMREMMYRVAAYQPIDWGSIMEEVVGKGRPKRKNVRISKEPQSVAARRRRERISERIHILQRLVPGGTKLDTASMLDEAIHYLKFLKLQVQALRSLDKYFTSSLPPLATPSPSHLAPFYPFNNPPSATSPFALKI